MIPQVNSLPKTSKQTQHSPGWRELMSIVSLVCLCIYVNIANKQSVSASKFDDKLHNNVVITLYCYANAKNAFFFALGTLI